MNREKFNTRQQNCENRRIDEQKRRTIQRCFQDDPGVLRNSPAALIDTHTGQLELSLAIGLTAAIDNGQLLIFRPER